MQYHTNARGVTFADDGIVALCSYVSTLDDANNYACWCDKVTQEAYNFKRTDTFAQYAARQHRERFLATIVRIEDDVPVGCVFVSSPSSLPDVAIMLYAPYRFQGYGTRAFRLAVQYCFSTLHLDTLYAGCFAGNNASEHMLKRCGFVRHPAGDVREKHYLSAAEITQFDYVLHKADFHV
jgi:RimJ/RimL family protein N-acetyltransferase